MNHISQTKSTLYPKHFYKCPINLPPSFQNMHCKNLTLILNPNYTCEEFETNFAFCRIHDIFEILLEISIEIAKYTD